MLTGLLSLDGPFALADAIGCFSPVARATRKAQVRVAFEQALSNLDDQLAARSSSDGSSTIASALRLEQARGRLFGLYLQLPSTRGG
jgi:hypothetical protein